MTPELMRELVLLTCPDCAANEVPTQRLDNREWVHDIVRGHHRVHRLCRASGLRNSKYGELING